MPASWEGLIADETLADPFSCVVHNALKTYDWKGLLLLSMIADRKGRLADYERDAYAEALTASNRAESVDWGSAIFPAITGRSLLVPELKGGG